MMYPVRWACSAFFLSICAFVNASPSPIIVTQPQSQTAVAGSSVTFSVRATGGGASGGSFPTVGSGTLKLWLKADAGVIAVNNRVSQWQDQSGNGNHAFQSDTNKQPILSTGAGPLGNKTVVRFDGIRSATLGDYMRGNGDLQLTNGYTSFLVYTEADPDVYEQLPAAVGEVNQFHSMRAYYIYNFNGITNEMGFASWTYDYGSGFRIPVNKMRIWTHRLNDAKSQLEYFDTDGVNDFTTNHPTSGMLNPSPGYYVGGAVFGKFYHLKGDIAELIYFQGKLTDDDRIAVETYLRQKYFGAGTAEESFTYQWRFNEAPISGATNASFTLNNVQPANAGRYSAVVSNLAASATSSNAVLTVIGATNHAPIVGSQLLSVNEDTSLAIVLTASDADADPLIYTVTTPTNGTLTGVAPNLVYRPKANFHGSDCFAFRVNDGHVNSARATVKITVLSVNDAPIAVAKATPAFLFSESDPMTVIIAPCDTNAMVILDGSKSYDIENDPIQGSWWEGTNLLASGIRVTNSFELGTHVLTLAVSDGKDAGLTSLTLEVITPAQAVAELAAFLEESSLPQKRKQVLAVSLNAAMAALSKCQMQSGINQLRVFESKVTAQVLPVYPAVAKDLLKFTHEILQTLTP